MQSDPHVVSRSASSAVQPSRRIRAATSANDRPVHSQRVIGGADAAVAAAGAGAKRLLKSICDSVAEDSAMAAPRDL